MSGVALAVEAVEVFFTVAAFLVDDVLVVPFFFAVAEAFAVVATFLVAERFVAVTRLVDEVADALAAVVSVLSAAVASAFVEAVFLAADAAVAAFVPAAERFEVVFFAGAFRVVGVLRVVDAVRILGSAGASDSGCGSGWDSGSISISGCSPW